MNVTRVYPQTRVKRIIRTRGAAAKSRVHRACYVSSLSLFYEAPLIRSGIKCCSGARQSLHPSRLSPPPPSRIDRRLSSRIAESPNRVFPLCFPFVRLSSSLLSLRMEKCTVHGAGEEVNRFTRVYCSGEPTLRSGSAESQRLPRQ